MSFLDLIKSKEKIKPQLVATPEWGELNGRVYIKHLNATDRVAFFEAAFNQKAYEGAAFQAFTAAFCSCDIDGNRLFNDTDWKSLQEEPGSVIERISEEADTLNCLTVLARETAKKNYGKIEDSGDTPKSVESSDAV